MRTNLQTGSGQTNHSVLLTIEERDAIFPFLKKFVKDFNESQNPSRNLTIGSYLVSEKSAEYVVSIGLISTSQEERFLFLEVLNCAIKTDFPGYYISHDKKIASIKIQHSPSARKN